jgi:arylsulfatase A-like enzyme
VSSSPIVRTLSAQHAVGLAVLATALLCAWLGTNGCAREQRPPNVLFIVIDTLRWDHLGAHGATTRDVSPGMDAFTRSGTLFERAYATAPWTRPSIGSMITGLQPSSHGGTAVDRPLPEDAKTVAELFAERGYATSGIVSNWVIARQNGFAQGYERYLDSPAALKHAPSSDSVSTLALRELDARAAAGAPFLLFVHYFDPHYRYNPHPEIGWSGGTRGRIAEKPTIFALRDLGPILEADERQNLWDLYAEEVRHTDHHLARLLDHLDALELADETIVVLVSDHGEEIFGRGYLGHAHSLYEELLRVPFAIRAPGLAPRRVSTPVSLLALTPTLLDLAGFETRALGFQADSLAPLMRGEVPTSSPLLFAEVDYLPDKKVERTARKRALIGERFKLIRDNDTGTLELYDLERDPGETRDLAEARPDVVARLLPILEERIRLAEAGSIDAPVRTLSEEEIRLLESLGYIEPDD